VLIGALLACLAGVVSADTITYGVTVNTSSISGTAGSLDFQFNPGPLVTQAASLQILSFASNGSLAGSPSLTGDVTGGPMPATLAHLLQLAARVGRNLLIPNKAMSANAKS
jgi:hypothetical protein